VDTASDTVTVQRTSTPLAMTWLACRRCSDDSCCRRPYLQRRQHTMVRDPMHDPYGTRHKDNDVCGTRREGQLLTQRLPSNHQSVLQTSQGP